MNDDPYGNLLPSSSVLPLPLALLLFLLFFVLGALFAMCESAAETANESRIKKDAESGEPRAKKLLEYLERSAGIISPLPGADDERKRCGCGIYDAKAA